MVGICEMDLSNKKTKSDAELLKEYRNSRSQVVLNQLYERHASTLTRDCYRATRNQERAEEAASLALLILARRPDVVNGQVSEWLQEAARCIAGN
jgi:DNA-directed RNA polymerase specialized sigma24 family protein